MRYNWLTGGGSGLVRAILKDPYSDFHARAVVRTRDSEKAAELARLGIEIVQANFDDMNSLKRAFHGAYGAYCVTDFTELLDPEKEIAQVANMAEAAKCTGLKHVIWSTFEDSREIVLLNDDRVPTVMGRYKLPQADRKAEANKEFIKRGIPTTFMLTSFYWDNFIQHNMEPKRDLDGILTLTMPMGNAKLPGIAAQDIGKCAYGLFKEGARYIGETVGITGGQNTGQEIANSYSKIIGEPVRYYAMSIEDFRAQRFPGVEIMANTFQIYRDFHDRYCAVRNLERLNPKILSFDE
ncbi:NmrA/HSCARG family protein [Zymomonas mobilis]|uniref:NmrA/HSCARG family protein n=1 Tax=Zymomonas mobilis TaxID=542 RepID=UPI001142C2BB|nr:NmrA/HSCARG family protein [Zymomonas mobilis]